MTLKPDSLDSLRVALAKAAAIGERAQCVDLSGLAKVREHTPEDMTVTVDAGVTLAALQAQLSLSGQWLPVDPPQAKHASVRELLDENLSGPRRFGYGTIREHLIGIGVVLADGRLIHAGGKVVKNVAGYDLCKLFVGARGTLGVIVEATFKLRPLPEAEKFVAIECPSLDDAGAQIERVMDSPLTPVVLDLHNGSGRGRFAVVLGLAGTRAEVGWQLERATELGFSDPADLDYERAFWAETGSPQKLSVAPSDLIAAIRSLGDVSFVARAGNGVVFHYGGPVPLKAELPWELFRRAKDAYDPKRVFPEPTP
jgi:glycolate oxidase FAD binding subunit